MIISISDERARRLQKNRSSFPMATNGRRLIAVELLDGEDVGIEEFYLPLTSTILTLKEQIEVHRQIPTADQRVFLNRDGGELLDSMPIAGLGAGPALYVERRFATIPITPVGGERFCLSIPLGSDVSYLKARIQESRGIPAADQRLFYRRRELANNERTPNRVEGGCDRLWLARASAMRGRVLIFLDDCRTDPCAAVKVDPDEKIRVLRARLGVPGFEFNGETLADTDTLRKRSIPALARLRVSPAPGEIKITVKGLETGDFVVYVRKGEDMAYELRSAIAALAGFDLFSFTSKGRFIDEHGVVTDEKFFENPVVHVSRIYLA